VLEARDQRQLDDVVALAREVLGSDLVAAYLYGSAVLSRLRHRSDLDVLVVNRRSTMPDQRRRLVDGLLPLSGRGATPRARSVELTVLVAGDVRPWRYPPWFDLQYGDWLRAQLERGELDAIAPPGPHPDVAILITTALQGAVALVGPRVGDMFEPVPWGDLVRAMTDELDGLLRDLEDDTANVLLTLARVWATLDSGAIQPKDVAADHVLEHLDGPARTALERAKGVYVGEADDEWDDLRGELRAVASRLVSGVRSAGPAHQDRPVL
jgi:predicted nucleotidyltransferase